MLLEDYAEALGNMDWYYDYSDDPRVSRRGAERHAEILKLANLSKNHRRLYDLCRTYQDNREKENHWRWVAAYLFVYGWRPKTAEMEGRRLVDARIGWAEVVTFRAKHS